MIALATRRGPLLLVRLPYRSTPNKLPIMPDHPDQNVSVYNMPFAVARGPVRSLDVLVE